jgi:homoserine/homoserine lactone efflux protein
VSLQTWLLFCATEAILCITPGPAVLLVVSQSLSKGPWAGLAACAGILAANTAYFALSATSVGALLVQSAEVFTAIKWLGAAYLVWLGAKMIVERRSAIVSASASTTSSGSTARDTRNAFSIAVITQGANPKALIFFTAILPQFISAGSPVVRQILILGISSVVIEFLVLGLYVATCHTARGLIHQSRFVVPIQRLAGVFLVLAGARLAVSRQV